MNGAKHNSFSSSLIVCVSQTSSNMCFVQSTEFAFLLLLVCINQGTANQLNIFLKSYIFLQARNLFSKLKTKFLIINKCKLGGSIDGCFLYMFPHN